VVDEWCLISNRRLNIKDPWKVLVVDHYEISGLIGDFRLSSGNDGNRLTRIPDAVTRQHGLSYGELTEAATGVFDNLIMRHIFCGQYRNDPRKFLGGACVDRGNRATRNLRAHDLAVEHAG